MRTETSTSNSLQTQTHTFDVCVVGGGMAGLCAAIASARNGARTCLLHDRPVLGGNASSEIRMWICGAEGKHDKETGILEEIQLENLYRNPSLNYSVWDSVLYGKAFFQPNLTTILNASCLDATMEGDRLRSIRAWQLTSQTWHGISATQFIDCSGDSILAPLTGAACRHGRESRSEFGESIQPLEADGKTMGNTLLIQMRRTDEPRRFIPPAWAYKITRPEDLPHRMNGVRAHNFWWIEVGGLQNTIADAEVIRDELMRIVYGVWDYIKNYAPARAEAANWAIEWIGSLPGKRENRRYIGDHVLTQNDIREHGRFDDIVAYGGWPMDDHHPAGMLYPGKPTIFHAAPSPYGIPYRCLYSRNIANLLCAGRNVSVTHAALSSVRVMGTCALMGQAAGTAAALAVQHVCTPRGVGESHLAQLQDTLMEDDAWLPGKRRRASDLAARAAISGGGEGVHRLLDGLDRDREGEPHAWVGRVGDAIEFAWPELTDVGGLRLVFDSNLANDKRMPCSYPQKGNVSRVPATLVKSFRVDVQNEAGQWSVAHREQNNYQRLLVVPIRARVRAVRWTVESTWGEANVRVFAMEPVSQVIGKSPVVAEGPHFRQLIERIPVADLRPPDSGLEITAGYRAPA